MSALGARAAAALRQPHNWIQGHFAYQGMRFYAVSVAAFAVNQFWLFVFIDWLGWGKTISQAVAIILVTPLNFLGNKLWSFRR